MKKRIVFPYDELGICNWSDVTLTNETFNGLGNKLMSGALRYSVKLNLDTDEKMLAWYNFYTVDLNNGTEPFLLRVPEWGPGVFKVVTFVSGTLEGVKTLEGWSVSFEIGTFLDDPYVYDENGEIVTADAQPEAVTDQNGDFVLDQNGLIVTATPLCEEEVVDQNGEVVYDQNGEPITASGPCQEPVTADKDCGAVMVKYKGDRVGLPNNGINCPDCYDRVGTFSRCFDPDNPLIGKHIKQVYDPYEGEFMMAYYKFEGNLHNHLAPPDAICKKAQYNGEGDTINHEYVDSRFKQGLRLSGGYGYFWVRDFPFVYHNSAMSFWLQWGYIINNEIFEARPKNAFDQLVTIRVDTSGPEYQLKKITVAGDYLLTPAVAEAEVYNQYSTGRADWYHVMIAFNTDHTVRIYVDGRDRTTQVGETGPVLNTADSFMFSSYSAFAIDELRFLHHKTYNEESARRIYNTGIRSTDYFMENALGSILLRMPKPNASYPTVYTCCSRYFVRDYGGMAARSEDSPFISDGLYKSYSNTGRLLIEHVPVKYRNITISAWTKTSAYDGEASADSHPFQMQFGAGFYFWIRNGEIQVTSSGAVTSWATAPQTGKLDTWEMYSFTIDQDGHTRVFVDGKDVTVTVGDQNATEDELNNIDVLSTTRDSSKSCKFAQIRYFSRVLTNKEMLELYDEHRSVTHW